MTDDISQVLKSHHVLTLTYLKPLPKPDSEDATTDKLAAVLVPSGHLTEEPTSADTRLSQHTLRCPSYDSLWAQISPPNVLYLAVYKG